MWLLILIIWDHVSYILIWCFICYIIIKIFYFGYMNLFFRKKKKMFFSFFLKWMYYLGFFCFSPSLQYTNEVSLPHMVSESFTLY